MSVLVRPCTPVDLQAAVAAARSAQAITHYEERYGWQRDGRGLLLLAWRGETLAGRVTLTFASKYQEVRARHPALAELNALGAEPTGHGVGTRLIEESLRQCRERDIDELGLAVEGANPAVRLYRRCGFVDWGGGPVVDAWTETHDDGTTTEHADPCEYLLRRVGG